VIETCFKNKDEHLVGIFKNVFNSVFLIVLKTKQWWNILNFQ